MLYGSHSTKYLPTHARKRSYLCIFKHHSFFSICSQYGPGSIHYITYRTVQRSDEMNIEEYFSTQNPSTSTEKGILWRLKKRRYINGFTRCDFYMRLSQW